MAATAGDRPIGPRAGPRRGTEPGLSGLLAMGAERYGGRLACRDQPDRDRWSGRAPLDWTYAVANRMVDRLAGFFADIGLPPARPVGLYLPAGSEFWLTCLALDRAGLTPCPIPAGWAEADLSRAIEAAHLQAVITQGRLGSDRPAAILRRAMSKGTDLRLAGAFGPDVPHGIVDLDRVMLARQEDDEPRRGAPAGRLTFDRRSAAPNPVYRPAASIAAATDAFLAAAAVEPGDRILTLMTGDSHAGLTTGLAAALAAGATLESHAIFDGAVLRDAILGSPSPTHLVAPAWSEPALAQSGLVEHVKSLVLVHRPPIRFEARPALPRNVLDVLALDETALITRARASGGGFARCFEGATGGKPLSQLLRLRLSGNGVIELAGLAADIRTFGRYGPAPRADAEWAPAGFQADLFAGIAIGVS